MLIRAGETESVHLFSTYQSLGSGDGSKAGFFPNLYRLEDAVSDQPTTLSNLSRAKTGVTKMNNIVRPHPWSVFTPSCPDVLEVPEFVLDNVLAAGTNVIAGQRGLGKTSALVPLMAIV